MRWAKCAQRGLGVLPQGERLNYASAHGARSLPASESVWRCSRVQQHLRAYEEHGPELPRASPSSRVRAGWIWRSRCPMRPWESGTRCSSTSAELRAELVNDSLAAFARLGMSSVRGRPRAAPLRRSRRLGRRAGGALGIAIHRARGPPAAVGVGRLRLEHRHREHIPKASRGDFPRMPPGLSRGAFSCIDLP
jgi:hypothetical protein